MSDAYALYATLHLHGTEMLGVTVDKSLLGSGSAENLAELWDLLLFHFIKHLAEPWGERDDSHPISSFEETMVWWEIQASEQTIP